MTDSSPAKQTKTTIIPSTENIGIDSNYFWSTHQPSPPALNRLQGDVWYIALPISSEHGSGHSGGNRPINDVRALNDETVYPHSSLVEIMTYHEECFPNIPMKYLDVSHEQWATLRQKIRENPPAVAAFSVYTSTSVWAYIVASEIKLANPDAIVIFGNDHATLLAEQILVGKYGRSTVDFIGLDNNGPYTMMALLHHLSNGLPIERVPSIAYRKAGSVHRQTAPNYPLSLRLLPKYDLILEYLEKYYDPTFQLWYGDYYELKRMITVSLDGGCAWGASPKRRCSHCSIVGLEPKQVRVDSGLQAYLEHVVSELGANVYNAGDSSLGFHSSSRLNISKKFPQVEHYLEQMREMHSSSDILRGRRYMLAYGQVSEFLDGGAELAADYVRTWNVGIEAFDPALLKADSKGVNKGIGEVRDALDLARQLGYLVYASGILGIAGTTKAQLKSEVENWQKMAEEYSDIFTNITVSLPAIVPGSKMYADAVETCEQGYITSDHHCEIPPMLQLTKTYIEQNSPDLSLEYVQAAAYEIRETIACLNANHTDKSLHIKTGTYAYDGLDESGRRELEILSENMDRLTAR